ncbi:MAG TPA: DUF2971 domain-containing protein [Saprospiraceae bacterium]|nr:DUF2971 domain-containing protein [Saprospiraceae bacterium]
MLVYKYRSGDADTLERDIMSLKRNYFYSPTVDKLNDPTEAITNSNPASEQIELFSLVFPSIKIQESLIKIKEAHDKLNDVGRQYMGIYSLSKIYNDELLWAHYANSHRGFCIEYDSDYLNNKYRGFKKYELNVEYSDEPPSFDFEGLNSSTEDKVKKIAGFKSKRWDYEKEFRIITDVYGEFYYEPEALKSIYFGIRMSEENKQKIIKALEGRKITFYDMVLEPNTYRFKRKINSITKPDEAFNLNFIPHFITKSNKVKYIIEHKEYDKVNKKGVLKIRVQDTINEETLIWLTGHLKENLFYNSSRVFNRVYLKHDSLDETPWANVIFENGNYKVAIHE